METSPDIIISGGGAVGLTLALGLLRHTQLRVAVVEKSSFIAGEEESNRNLQTVALSYASAQYLSSLGISSILDIAAPIHHIHVSDKGHIGQTQLHHSEFDVSALGYVASMKKLVDILYKAVSAYDASRLSIYDNTQLKGLSVSQNNVTIDTSNAQKLTTQLLVIAEGASSQSKEWLKIDSQIDDYQQSAIVCNVQLDRTHENWAFERFTEFGPLALLPIKDDGGNKHSWCSVVWSMSNSKVALIKAMSSRDFLQALQEMFGHRLGRFVDVSHRQSFPLRRVTAKQNCAHRTVLIGNAAQTLHPIAGQGLNLALRDVSSLVSHLASNQYALGEYQQLRDYQKSRKQDVVQLNLATDSLVRIFSNQFLPMVIGRNIGLAALGCVPHMKQVLAKSAMGLTQQGKE